MRNCARACVYIYIHTCCILVSCRISSSISFLSFYSLRFTLEFPRNSSLHLQSAWTSILSINRVRELHTFSYSLLFHLFYFFSPSPLSTTLSLFPLNVHMPARNCLYHSFARGNSLVRSSTPPPTPNPQPPTPCPLSY